MSKVKVQCKGSGRKVTGNVNMTKARCPACGRDKPVTGNGRIRRHDRLTTTAKLRKMSR